MGIFTGLLLLPLAPVRMTAWLAERIGEEAERELGEQPLRRELAELDAAHAAGEVGAAEYAERQEVLLQALLATRREGGRYRDG